MTTYTPCEKCGGERVGVKKSQSGSGSWSVVCKPCGRVACICEPGKTAAQVRAEAHERAQRKRDRDHQHNLWRSYYSSDLQPAMMKVVREAIADPSKRHDLGDRLAKMWDESRWVEICKKKGWEP